MYRPNKPTAGGDEYVCVREDENMLSAYERGRKKVYLRVCVCLRAVSINGRINGSISVKNAT